MGKKWKQWGFIFLGSKITANGDYSLEIKRRLLLGRTSMTKLNNILKSRDHFAHKGPYSQSWDFYSSQVQMWEVDHKEGWALRNWCVRTVVLEKTLRVPWTARRSNQSIWKEINPEYSSEELMLKVKLQYFGHLLWRANSLGNFLMLGKIEGMRKRGQQRIRWLDGIIDSMVKFEQTQGDIEGKGRLTCCSPWGAKSWTWLNNNIMDVLVFIHVKIYS